MSQYQDDNQYIKMKIGLGVLRSLFVRDEDGNRLRLELRGPDEDGFFDGVVTVDYDDNLLKKAQAPDES
jgi:hypothetical protein